MDWKKLKWKMGFRKEKLKGLLQLCKYEFRHKFNLDDNDGAACYLMRQTLWSRVKADPEQEYLEVHGLLPKEPEEEQEPEQEPEPIAEPGLMRRFDNFEMLYFVLRVGERLFCVDELKEFEDRTEVTVKITDPDRDEELMERAVVPHRSGERYDPVTLGGEEFRWDRADGRLRYMPVVCEDVGQAAEKGPVRAVQDLVLRVDKALAEERLSPLCLEYACRSSDAWYDWCLQGNCHYPVLHELQMATTEEAAYQLRMDMAYYCPHYCEKSGLT